MHVQNRQMSHICYALMMIFWLIQYFIVDVESNPGVFFYRCVCVIVVFPLGNLNLDLNTPHPVTVMKDVGDGHRGQQL